jgi:protein SCO1/2
MKVGPTRLAVMVSAFAAGLVLCIGAILWLTGNSPNAIVTQPSAVGGPFRLTDQDGQTVSDETLRGKPFLVFFGFTHCPDVCPTTLFEVSEVMRRLGKDADRTAALFISVDPERDTPEKLKEFLSSFDPHLRGLTGDAETMAAVARKFRVYYKKVPLEGGDYTMDHTALVYLMDKRGQFVAPFSLKRTPEAAAAELKKYL